MLPRDRNGRAGPAAHSQAGARELAPVEGPRPSEPCGGHQRSKQERRARGRDGHAWHTRARPWRAPDAQPGRCPDAGRTGRASARRPAHAEGPVCRRRFRKTSPARRTVPGVEGTGEEAAPAVRGDTARRPAAGSTSHREHRDTNTEPRDCHVLPRHSHAQDSGPAGDAETAQATRAPAGSARAQGCVAGRTPRAVVGNMRVDALSTTTQPRGRPGEQEKARPA